MPIFVTFFAVLGGMLITLISLFGGFMIKYQDFPDFWVFMYWLDPLHYVMEGLVTTQFNLDHTDVVVKASGQHMTAQGFVQYFYSAWKYKNRGYDIMALCLFIIALRSVFCCFLFGLYLTLLCCCFVQTRDVLGTFADSTWQAIKINWALSLLWDILMLEL